MDYFGTNSYSDCNFCFVATTNIGFGFLLSFSKKCNNWVVQSWLIIFIDSSFYGIFVSCVFCCFNWYPQINCNNRACSRSDWSSCLFFFKHIIRNDVLSKQFGLAETNEQKVILLASGKVMLTRYTGTAFGVYYILNGLSLVLFSIAMIRNKVFSKKIAYIGLAAGILMLVPSTAGTVGMAFALVSLIPTSLWLVMIARRFSQLSQNR